MFLRDDVAVLAQVDLVGQSKKMGAARDERQRGQHDCNELQRFHKPIRQRGWPAMVPAHVGEAVSSECRAHTIDDVLNGERGKQNAEQA